MAGCPSAPVHTCRVNSTSSSPSKTKANQDGLSIVEGYIEPDTGLAAKYLPIIYRARKFSMTNGLHRGTYYPTVPFSSPRNRPASENACNILQQLQSR